MNNLVDIYENSNKKNNARREYRALEQDIRLFMKFYTEFVYLIEICDYNKSIKLYNIKYKIRKRL